MPTIITVTCDAPGCGRDLTDTDDLVSYRLVLISQPIFPIKIFGKPNRTLPSLDRDYVFCNLACLRQWCNREGSFDSAPQVNARIK